MKVLGAARSSGKAMPGAALRAVQDTQKGGYTAPVVFSSLYVMYRNRSSSLYSW